MYTTRIQVTNSYKTLKEVLPMFKNLKGKFPTKTLKIFKKQKLKYNFCHELAETWDFNQRSGNKYYI
jgi:hypothetical protein